MIHSFQIFWFRAMWVFKVRQYDFLNFTDTCCNTLSFIPDFIESFVSFGYFDEKLVNLIYFWDS